MTQGLGTDGWARMMEDFASLTPPAKFALYQGADVMAKVAGLVDDEGEPLGLNWMVQDHPARANLLLERLGMPERF